MNECKEVSSFSVSAEERTDPGKEQTLSSAAIKTELIQVLCYEFMIFVMRNMLIQFQPDRQTLISNHS